MPVLKPSLSGIFASNHTTYSYQLQPFLAPCDHFPANKTAIARPLLSSLPKMTKHLVIKSCLALFVAVSQHFRHFSVVALPPSCPRKPFEFVCWSGNTCGSCHNSCPWGYIRVVKPGSCGCHACGPITCPVGPYTNTWIVARCICPSGTVKEVKPGGTSYVGQCVPDLRPTRAPTPPPVPLQCPSRTTFSTTGKYHKCYCATGLKKRYHGLFNSGATCFPVPYPCPRGREFSTTGIYRGCTCTDPAEFKRYYGLFKAKARCEPRHKNCPAGEFSTTGYWHKCHCSSTHFKRYLNIFKSKARCEPRHKICPSGKWFSTTGYWHGCHCCCGKKKRYRFFNSKGYC